MCFARIESIIDTNSNTVLNKLNNQEGFPTRGLMFGLYRAGHEIHFSLVGDGGLTAFVKTSGVAGSLNNWYHWAYTWDASISSTFLSACKFYQDGVQGTVIDSFDGTKTVTQINNSDGDMQIGRRGANVNTWDGQISHVKMYDRALTQGEIIESVYNPEAIMKGLVSWWPLTTTGAKDMSGGGFNGTIVGGVVDSDRGTSYNLSELKG